MSDFNLVQVEIVDDFDDAIKASYEVIDPDKETIGRFGTLKEAQKYIELLRHFDDI